MESSRFGQIIKPFEDILAEMKGIIEENQSQMTDWNPGSALRTICESSAHVNYLGYIDLLTYTLMAFPQYAVGIYLDEWASPFEVFRKMGSAASCSSVKIYVSPSGSIVTIPAGTRLATNEPAPRFYITTQDVVIQAGDSFGITPVVAEDIGTKYNCPPFYITRIINASGVAKVENTTAATGGEDEESDTAFRERFFLYLRHGLARGTEAAIRFATLSVDGVSSASVKRNLPEYWQRWQHMKFEFDGVWYDVASPAHHYGSRKVGTGLVTVRFYGKKVKLHLWSSSAYGEAAIDYGDGNTETVNLTSTNLRRVVREYEYATEGFKCITIDTGEGEISIESADIWANYSSTLFVFVDDGTGNASWELIRTVFDELEDWAGVTANYFVNRCEKRFVALDLLVKAQPGLGISKAALTEHIKTAVTAYVNTLVMGQPLYLSQLQKAALKTGFLQDCVATGADILPEKNEILRVSGIEVRIV